jgi:hypothetical protein
VNTQTIFIGGIVPAVLLGVGTVLMRASIGAGASIPIYLAAAGTAIAMTGWLAIAATGVSVATKAGIGLAAATGLSWAFATACMAYGVGTLKLPVSVVAPLVNSNVLVAVLLGAQVFSEWRDLSMVRVTTGVLLICGGATVISFAK